MSAVQLDLFAAHADTHGLCQYGHPANVGVCDRPATHGARWRKGETVGGLDCCRPHADYYAKAWVPLGLRMGWTDIEDPPDEAAWVEILGAAA